MKTGNIAELPVFIDVHDVMRTMKCSRSMAYCHMRAALGRGPGERGQLRVPLYVWQRYVRARFDRQASLAEGARKIEPAAAPPTPSSPIPITRPRTKPRTSIRVSEER